MGKEGFKEAEEIVRFLKNVFSSVKPHLAEGLLWEVPFADAPRLSRKA